MRGHVDLKSVLWIWATLGVIGVEAIYRYWDGRSLLGEYWASIAMAAALLVLIIALVAGWRWYARPRNEGLYSDGERLLAAFKKASK